MTDTGAPENSAFSSENVLKRISGARGQATKEANRLFLVSLTFAGLFLIKASGLRVDLTLLDTNVAKVPHGVFFFLVASQVSMILAYMRTADSAALDSRLREAIESFGVEDVSASERTFVNEFEWFSPTETEFPMKAPGRLSRFFYNFTSLLTSLTAILFYIFPSIAGIYVLMNHETLIASGNTSLQLLVIFITTLMSILWFLSFLSVWSTMRK